jgi:cytochrome P450
MATFVAEPLLLQVALDRLALRPFTFSNGMTIPAGTLISLPLCAIHMEEETYSNPDQFDGFRFTTLGDSDGKAAKTKHSATSTATDFLAFGLGRHAW